MAFNLGRVKLPHMRLIAAVADRGQLQQAADDLGLTQPAASRTLAEVERLVGMPLFERHPKGMVPTEVGRAAVRQARMVVAQVNEFAREVTDHQQGLAGLVRAGAVTGAAVACLVPAIRRLRTVAPRVEVRADVGPSTVLLPALDEGSLDFIIGRLLPDSDPSDYVVLPGQPEPIAFLVRRGHPLADLSQVGLGDLVGFDWVFQERGTPIRTAVDAALLAAGVPMPKVSVYSASLLVTIALVAGSDAVAPTGREAAMLLCNAPVGAGFVALATDEAIELPFYHIISARARTLSRAALRLRTLVQTTMMES